MQFSGKGILLDIEGTTSSIRFVYDVMFPYVRRELDPFLEANWHTTELIEACDLIAQDAGYSSLDQWCGGNPSDEEVRQLVRKEVFRLMDADIKATGLKHLQGLIWKAGFGCGEMKAHLYEDVLPAIQSWHQAGKDIRIYSSGSIAAQKLFFTHTARGNLLNYLNGHFDTTTGPKNEADSYRIIAREYGLPSSEILFISDVPQELDAAKNAGMKTALSVRPENQPVEEHTHPKITSFDKIII